MHEGDLGIARDLFPAAGPVWCARVRVHVRARVGAVVEREPVPVRDLVSEVRGQPEALLGPYKTDHPIHHVVVDVAVEHEVAFEAMQLGVLGPGLRVLHIGDLLVEQHHGRDLRLHVE